MSSRARSSGETPALWVLHGRSSPVYYQVLSYDTGGQSAPAQFPADLHHLIPDFTPFLEVANRYVRQPRPLAYCRQDVRGTLTFIALVLAHDTSFEEVAVQPATPDWPGPYAVTERLTPAGLVERWLQIQEAFTRNADAPESVLTYLREAWYFIPMHIGLQLCQAHHFPAALDWFRTVYEYGNPWTGAHNIYGVFAPSGEVERRFRRGGDWLLDPLNPHAIAASRSGAHARFVLMTIVRCLLDYADAEFTRDTAESLPRARTLYTTALSLLGLDELNQEREACRPWIDAEAPEIDPRWHATVERLNQGLGRLEGVRVRAEVASSVKAVLQNDTPMEQRYGVAEHLVRDAIAEQAPPPRIGRIVEESRSEPGTLHGILLALPAVVGAVLGAGEAARKDYATAVDHVTYLRNGEDGGSFTWLIHGAETSSSPVVGAEFMGSDAALAHSNPLLTLKEVRIFTGVYTPAPSRAFCVPPNPLLKALRARAEINLFKLRTCRNIAGLERPVEPYAAPTDSESGLPTLGAGGSIVFAGAAPSPTAYRAVFLIERAKQFADRAGQMEAAFLSALEKRDAEAYTLLKARQDLELARAGVRLQNLRVREAEHGVRLAELQTDRAQIQVDQYAEWLSGGLSTYEELSLAGMFVSLTAPDSISWGTGYSISVSPSGKAETLANIFATLASYERRSQEWTFQLNLATQDVLIGQQQKVLANDHVDIVKQERHISDTQAGHAEAAVDFLSEKFTSVELYDWMSGVLEGIYSTFLQMATTTALMAESQLAFERQEQPAGYILRDYWGAPDEGAPALDGERPDRRGLTGSARLLADIYRLDQYRFETERRKHQLTRTVSLAHLDPAAFQRFKETGVLRFATTQEMFDRDFPGHYLRLVRRVRTSVIALIPPTEGIRATLSMGGVSRVVVDRDGLFQTLAVRRPPESVAFTSPSDATGLFDLQPQQPEMLFPFEGAGVDASWELRMPRAANLFDTGTLADVLLTLEYTALESFAYRQQVVPRLGRTIQGERPFRFRSELADAWYDLNNPPEGSTGPLVASFQTRREDFPSALERLQIEHVVLYFQRVSGATFEVPVENLQFTEQHGASPFRGGSVESRDGVISTRRGAWPGVFSGRMTIGAWELALPRSVLSRITGEEIQDMLFVITYSGQAPAWPA